MKKVLVAISASTILLSSCGGNGSDGSYGGINADGTVSKMYHTTDTISDAWTKDYDLKDMEIINKGWKSTLGYYEYTWKFPNNDLTPDQEEVCRGIAKGTSEDGDITKRWQQTVPYMNKAQNPHLKKFHKDGDSSKGSIDGFTHLKGGEISYGTRGTAWVIAQNTSHYFVATNHHVALAPTYDNGATTGPMNGPGKLWACTLFASINPDGSNSVAMIDRSIGNKGLVFNGRAPSNGSQKNIDLAIVAVKKGDFHLDMPTMKISKKVPAQPTKEETRQKIKDMLAENVMYTTGYPAGVRRYNKAVGLPKYWYLRYGNEPADLDNDGVKDETGFVTGKGWWNFDHAEVNFWTSGGSSGSPVYNAQGEIEFINAVGLSNAGRFEDDDEWTSARSAGIPAHIIDEALQKEFCEPGLYNLDICV